MESPLNWGNLVPRSTPTTHASAAPAPVAVAFVTFPELSITTRALIRAGVATPALFTQSAMAFCLPPRAV